MAVQGNRANREPARRSAKVHLALELFRGSQYRRAAEQVPDLRHQLRIDDLVEKAAKQTAREALL